MDSSRWFRSAFLENRGGWYTPRSVESLLTRFILLCVHSTPAFKQPEHMLSGMVPLSPEERWSGRAQS